MKLGASKKFKCKPTLTLAVDITIDSIQLLVNLRFIQVLVAFLRESTSPLFENKLGDKERVKLSDPCDSSLTLSGIGESQEEKQSMQISANIIHPLIALLEDVRKMAEPAALVCQVSR